MVFAAKVSENFLPVYIRRGRGSRGTSEERMGVPTAATAAAAVAATPLSPESLWEKLSNTSDKKVSVFRKTSLSHYHHYPQSFISVTDRLRNKYLHEFINIY